MTKECSQHSDQTVGDDKMQYVRRARMSRLVFPALLAGIGAMAIVIAVMFVVRTFRPIPYPTAIKLDVSLNSDSEKAGVTRFSDAEKANLKLELSEALLTMEARAAAIYNEKFATLLTLLTIFGIAWPVMIAFIQFKFNEKELAKIDETSKRAEESLTLADEAQKQANAAIEKAEESLAAIKRVRIQIFEDKGNEVFFAALNKMDTIKDWNSIPDRVKAECSYQLVKAIDFSIEAICVDTADSNNLNKFLIKIEKICDQIEKIEPVSHSTIPLYEYRALLSKFSRIPEHEIKTKIIDRLQKTENKLEKQCLEAHVSE